MLWCVSQWFLVPLHCRTHQGIFLSHLLWGPGRAPRGTSHNTGGPPALMTVLLEFFPLQVVYTEPPVMRHLRSRFPTRPCFLRWFLPRSLRSGKPRPPVFTCRSLQPRRTGICPVSSPHGPKKSWWFFHVFSFLLVGRTERASSSSSQGKLAFLSFLNNCIYLIELWWGSNEWKQKAFTVLPGTEEAFCKY